MDSGTNGLLEMFGKRHADVLRVIDNINEEVRDERSIAFIFYKDSMNRKQKVYKLNNYKGK